MAADSKGLLIFGGVAAGLYFLYEYLSSSCPGSSAGLCPIYNDIFGTTAAATSAPPQTPAPTPLTAAQQAAVTAASQQTSPPQSTTNPTPITQVAVTPPVQSPAAQVLTAQDADSFAYISSITPAQMQAINTQVDAELQAGQVPQIGGNSVLAYMLSWGGAAQGTIKTVYGLTYNFDGTNWNLQTANLGRLGTIMNNQGTDLYTGFYFSNGSAGADPAQGLGQVADERFAGSRVPGRMIHGGPGYQLSRRAS
jgi:hypothetical protein